MNSCSCLYERSRKGFKVTKTQPAELTVEQARIHQKQTMAHHQDGVVSDCTCLSGGAEGADRLFGELAASVAHEVVHYGFEGMKSTVQPQVTVLDSERLDEATLFREQAAIYLVRCPPRKPHVRKLIQRNFFQVKTAESVYAISRWNLVEAQSKETAQGKLRGGTGWAVAVAISIKVPKIYFFAIEKTQWYRYSYAEGRWEKKEAASIPTPQGRYAGIGSRELDSVGEKALRDLYREAIASRRKAASPTTNLTSKLVLGNR